jgi:hypothetical protein
MKLKETIMKTPGLKDNPQMQEMFKTMANMMPKGN